jgi:hypothetical protein
MQPALPTMPCPHCGAANPAGSTFCQSCGKAVPTGASGTPRLVTGDAVATTGVGFNLQTDELHKQAKKAAGALLAVAIIMSVFAAIFAANINSRTGRGNAGPFEVNTFAVVIQVVLAAVFWGLWIWARSQPLPPAIVGLVIYGTLVAVNVVSAISLMNQGGQATGFGGLGIGFIDIIIMVVLFQSINAGIKYRKLMRSMAAPGFPM